MDTGEEILTIQVVIIAMIIVFMLSLAVILFFIVYQRRLLRQQKAYQEDLLKAVIEGQEQERNRVAKELHDDLGAMLTTTKLYTGQISPDLPAEEVAKLKTKIGDFFEEMITSTRRISQDLRPVILEKLGLEEGVKSLVEDLNATGAMNVHLKTNFNRLAQPESALNFYRIIQELLNNTIKHSGATEVKMTLVQEGKDLTLNYVDNGRGVDLKTLKHKKGIGLKNIESRTSIEGGKLQFIAVERGFHLHVRIPNLIP